MKIGLDAYSLRDKRFGTAELLEYAAANGFDGVLGGGWGTPEENREYRQRAESLGLYTEVSLGKLNPHQLPVDHDEQVKTLKKKIREFSGNSWFELHAVLGNGSERYESATPWEQQLDDCANFIARLREELRENGCRVNIETHGDCTTSELLRLIEKVGEDVCGICLDTANVLCHAEDPLEAIRRAAPFTHMTHLKDANIYLEKNGYIRETVPAGKGSIDWQKGLAVLFSHNPHLNLSIEDHKWLFHYPVLEQSWLALHPDLSVSEYALVLETAWNSRQQVWNGEREDPHQAETTPHLEQVDARLLQAKNHLRNLMEDLSGGRVTKA